MDLDETQPDDAQRFDRAFVLALDHFLRTRGWSVQLFSQITHRRCPESPIHPYQISRWRTGKTYPSMDSVITACATFGISRSFFFFVGERLLAAETELEELEKDPKQTTFRLLHEAIPNLEDPTDVKLLMDLETYVVRQMTRLKAQDDDPPRDQEP